MTQTIKLELPTDNASVLHHMGNALQSIADELSTPKPNVESVTLNAGPVPTMTGEQLKALNDLERVYDTKVEFEKPETPSPEEIIENIDNSEPCGEVVHPPIEETIESVSPPIVTGSTDNLDKNGIPWDNRIHSRGKTRNADDTWRNARCPKDKTADEWNAYIAEVETELKALMEIPVTEQAITSFVDIATTVNASFDAVKYWRNVEMNSCGEVNGEEALTEFLNKFPNAEPISFEQYEAFQASLDDEAVVEAVTPPVVEAGLPVPPITPPVVELPTPPVEVSTTVQLNPHVSMEQVANVATQALNEVVSELNVPKNFGELMKFITTNNKKLTSEAVKQVIADQGLASIALLAPRPELIPQVHAALVELL